MENTDKITLPYTIKRGANMPIIIPVMIVQPVVIVGGILALLYSRGGLGQEIKFVVFALLLLIPAEIVASIFLLRTMRPAEITFNRGFITEKPIPVIGFASAPERTMEMAEFAAVKMTPAANKQLTNLSLKRHSGPDYPVRTMLNRAVADQLAKALGLPVEGV